MDSARKDESLEGLKKMLRTNWFNLRANQFVCTRYLKLANATTTIVTIVATNYLLLTTYNYYYDRCYYRYYRN